MKSRDFAGNVFMRRVSPGNSEVVLTRATSRAEEDPSGSSRSCNSSPSLDLLEVDVFFDCLSDFSASNLHLVARSEPRSNCAFLPVGEICVPCTVQPTDFTCLQPSRGKSARDRAVSRGTSGAR